MYSQCISVRFKLDNAIWYFNQERKMISIGNIAKFNSCFDNNFYYIADHLTCVFIISVIKSIYKNFKSPFHLRFTNFNNNNNNTSNVKTQINDKSQYHGLR